MPRLLPAAPAHFAGRARELRALNELLSQAMGADGRGVIWVVDGTAGVGKTALAVYWAHQVADEFPDGQLYVNLRGFGPSDCPVTPEEAIRGLLSALQVPSAKIPETLDAQAALYRSTLAGKRMLILLDNARDEGQVRPLLPGGAACPVLVTSRSSLTGLVAAEGAHPLSLDVLSDEDSCELLTRQLGTRRVSAEPEAARALAGLCAGLPLALAVAAARAAARLAVTGRAAEAGFDRHAWQIPWAMRNFLDREGHWHDWARTQRAALAAAGRLADRAGQAHAHRNIGRACLRLGRYDDAGGHLRDGLALYRQLGHYYGQARTHFEIAWGAERQGHYGEALAHSRQALEAFRAAGDRQGAAIALNTQGWCLTQLGSHQQALACSRQALAVLQETGHDGGEAAAWMTVGVASHHLGRDLEALACYQRALALHRALGDRYHQSRTLVYLGEAHGALGSPAAARQAWRQALEILEALHHPEAAQVRSLLEGLPAPRSEIPRQRHVAHAGS